MKKQPLVSVIIPTFNRADLIAQTVSSALKQCYQNIEIIVVDDASTDASVAAVQRINDPRIKYVILKQNSGPSAARNIGVTLARGQFIAFLDSDDLWDIRKIELQMAAVKKHPNPTNVVCYTQATVVEDHETYLLPTRGKESDESVGDYVMCGNHGLIQTSTIMLPRQLALAYPFAIGQKHGEDWDLFLRLEERGVEWVYLDQPLATWHNNSRGDRLATSSFDGTQWLDEHKHYLSEKAQLSYTMSEIVYPLIRDRARKLYSLKKLFIVFRGQEITFLEFLKYTAKIFLPPVIIKRVKALFLSLHQRNIAL